MLTNPFSQALYSKLVTAIEKGGVAWINQNKLMISQTITAVGNRCGLQEAQAFTDLLTANIALSFMDISDEDFDFDNLLPKELL